MQEIEYRAWIKQLELLRPVERINFDISTVDLHLSDSGDYHNDLFEYSFDEVELSQYIGIKDIHGKKVYRGDIVKIRETIYEDCSREEVEETREYIGEIVWHQFGYHIAEKIEDGIRYHSLWLWDIEWEEDDTMEILGNRWDNQEMAVIK